MPRIVSEETRRKISATLKGRPQPEERNRKVAEKLKGRPLSEERKQKISNAQKGRTFSDEHRQKLTGPRKGPEYANPRNCPEYYEFVATVKKRDDYKCRCCSCDSRLEVHHPLDFDEFPEHRYDPDNGVTLCYPCHMKEHHRIKRIKEGKKASPIPIYMKAA